MKAVLVLVIALLVALLIWMSVATPIKTPRLEVPTAVQIVVDKGVIARRVRGLNELLSREHKETHRYEGSLNNAILGTADTLQLDVTTTALVGVELSELSDADIQVSGTDITVQLPEVKILHIGTDSQVVDRQSAWWTILNQDAKEKAILLEQNIRQSGEASNLAAICESGILEQATRQVERNTEQQIALFVPTATNITVNATVGSCR